MNNDLISREALKKALKSNCDLCHDKNTNWCEHCCPLNDFEDLIDNAPAVPIPVDQIVWESGYECGNTERPQGEWKKTIYGFYTCSNCDNYGNPNYFDYCPKCGAYMRGGNNE